MTNMTLTGKMAAIKDLRHNFWKVAHVSLRSFGIGGDLSELIIWRPVRNGRGKGKKYVKEAFFF